MSGLLNKKVPNIWAQRHAYFPNHQGLLKEKDASPHFSEQGGWFAQRKRLFFTWLRFALFAHHSQMAHYLCLCGLDPQAHPLFFNATRCVPTPLIGCSAGSRQARKMRKNTWIVPRRLLNESERFRWAVRTEGITPFFPLFRPPFSEAFRQDKNSYL